MNHKQYVFSGAHCPISKLEGVIYDSRLTPIEEGAQRNKLLLLRNRKTAVSRPLNQGLKPGRHLTSAKVFTKWSDFQKIDKNIGKVMGWHKGESCSSLQIVFWSCCIDWGLYRFYALL